MAGVLRGGEAPRRPAWGRRERANTPRSREGRARGILAPACGARSSRAAQPRAPGPALREARSLIIFGQHFSTGRWPRALGAGRKW